jgi:hypothetical protein
LAWPVFFQEAAGFAEFLKKTHEIQGGWGIECCWMPCKPSSAFRRNLILGAVLIPAWDSVAVEHLDYALISAISLDSAQEESMAIF